MKTITAPKFQPAHPLANGIAAVHLLDAKTRFSISHRKEKNGFYAEYSALVPYGEDSQELKAVVSLRLYWPGTVCYACAWISSYIPGSNREYISTHGSGQAGGGGYCKASAAAQAAIDNAGFALSEPIDGRGTDKIKDAVLAIAHALGFPEARVHVAHA